MTTALAVSVWIVSLILMYQYGRYERDYDWQVWLSIRLRMEWEEVRVINPAQLDG